MEILKVVNLNKSYIFKQHILEKPTKVEVLKGINFTLKAGENLAILGSSGSGKSTLARQLCMLEQIDSGEIWFDDFRIDGLKFSQQKLLRDKIQYVFQNQKTALNPRKSVISLLKDVIINFNLDVTKDEILDLLHSLGLEKNVLEKKPNELSGGMASRVGLARALLVHPKVLILDEVTSGLDFISQMRLLSLLKELQSSYKFSIIFITHSLKVAEYIAPNVIIMEHGEIAFDGKFEDAKQNEAYKKFQSALLISHPKFRKSNLG